MVDQRRNTEDMIGLVARTIAEQALDHVRVLTENRSAGQAGADVLLQIDDYDLRLVIEDPLHGRPALVETHLLQLLAILEANPNTVAVIVVWTTDDDLYALPFSPTRLRFLRQNPARLPSLLTRGEPLLNVLRTIIAQQTRLWDSTLDTAEVPRRASPPLRQLFQTEVVTAIEAERKRTYRTEERKQAARHFPVAAEQHLIMAIFDRALKGESSASLIAQFTCLPRRGDR